MTEEYITTAEARERLGVTRQRVLQLVHRGRIRGKCLAYGDTVRWELLAEDVEKYAAGRKGVDDE